ncbi:MAG: hypothetical protein N2491_12340 [Negativicutes bacterium]|nr:hypothetical protein [Negativicutes bacterium]
MKHRKLITWLAATLVFQLTVYLYLDKILLAPSSAYQVSATADQAVTSGKAYYSRDRRYMTIVKNSEVEIYAMPGRKPVRTVDTGSNQVTYFKWLEDRDLGLMGLYSEQPDGSRVVLTQVNPEVEGQGLATTISKLPKGSKIVDVAYSTATNVIYIQVQTGTNPDMYRVYRTDANQELARIYFNTGRIGRIGVLFDQDSLVFDDLEKDAVFVRHGDGSWQAISPQNGKYRLVGVDLKNTVYLARLNAGGLAETIYTGKLGGRFREHRKLNAPTDVRNLKVNDVLEGNM